MLSKCRCPGLHTPDIPTPPRPTLPGAGGGEGTPALALSVCTLAGPAGSFLGGLPGNFVTESLRA